MKDKNTIDWNDPKDVLEKCGSLLSPLTQRRMREEIDCKSDEELQRIRDRYALLEAAENISSAITNARYTYRRGFFY